MCLIPITSRGRKGLRIMLQLLLLIFLLFIVIAFPENIFPAAKQGIDIWWKVVFPGLFPFFVLSEVMLQLGVVNFLGVFLEPIMRPIFNVPGSGAMVLAAGFTSGAPTGGIITSQLQEKHMINREEASRLVAFTNNASPLFMLSSVAIGFLGRPELGWILASSHYIANICVGILLRFLSKRSKEPTVVYSIKQLFLKSLRKMYQAQRKNTKSLGSLLGDAVRKSMQNILIVGGFIIVFSVLIEIFKLLGILKILAIMLGYLLLPLGLEASLMLPLASGIMEMTTGIKMISESGAPVLQQLVSISLLLGWAGIAIHAQVIAFIGSHNTPVGPYFLARGLQSILAAILTLLIGNRFLPVSHWEIIHNQPAPGFYVLQSLKLSGVILLILALGSLTMTLINRAMNIE